MSLKVNHFLYVQKIMLVNCRFQAYFLEKHHKKAINFIIEQIVFPTLIFLKILIMKAMTKLTTIIE